MRCAQFGERGSLLDKFFREKKTLKRRVALTAKYESEYLIVFGEEDPMRDVRSNKKKVDMTGGLLES
jgi:hypothetical protein